MAAVILCNGWNKSQTASSEKNCSSDPGMWSGFPHDQQNSLGLPCQSLRTWFPKLW